MVTTTSYQFQSQENWYTDGQPFVTLKIEVTVFLDDLVLSHTPLHFRDVVSYGEEFCLLSSYSYRSWYSRFQTSDVLYVQLHLLFREGWLIYWWQLVPFICLGMNVRCNDMRTNSSVKCLIWIVYHDMEQIKPSKQKAVAGSVIPSILGYMGPVWFPGDLLQESGKSRVPASVELPQDINKTPCPPCAACSKGFEFTTSQVSWKFLKHHSS